MKHLFIINPIAGKIGEGEKRLIIEKAINELKTENFALNYEIYITKAPLDATKKIAADAASQESLRVYAIGGDGTLNECVNGAAFHENVSVTVFPLGTGNDFIKSFGERSADFYDLKKLIKGTPKKIDLIDCNGRLSVNVCSVGFDARVGGDVHKFSRGIFRGSGAYILSVISNFFKSINSNMKVSAENAEYSPNVMLACACNGKAYGGGFCPVPEAEIDDGFLDCLVVINVNRWIFAKAVLAYKKGNYRKFPKYIKHIKTKELKIVAENEEYINLDGEIQKAREITMKILPKALDFIFPASL